MALPTAGMCELVTPPMILANPVSSPRRELLHQPLAFGEQLGLELLRRDALEGGTRVLHRRAARNRHLRHVVDVRPGPQHAEEVLAQYQILRGRIEPEAIAIRRRIAIEGVAV